MCRLNENNEARSDAGFTMDRGAGCAGRDRDFDDRLSVVETARAVLAALPDREQLTLGNLSGKIGDNRWRIDVLPFAADFVDAGHATPWIPQAVVIRVESPMREILRLDTVRLQRAQGSQ